MANQEHLAILREQGVAAWNELRKQHRAATSNQGALPGSVDLSGVNLRGSRLSGADLSGVVFEMADLSEADLSGANLVRADLAGADLRRTNLRRANLSSASLRGASLMGADLQEADLRDTLMAGTNVTDVDLSETLGLETCTHWGPSSIGIDTIFKSRGALPQAFLKGAGVPDVLIAQMKALVSAMSPIQFYSCFISYSSADQNFAERLHADLQSKSVRCWFAPEDLKIGDKFRSRIDESIRVFDKFLLVLTEKSIVSPWVEEEVETALEWERRDKKLILFPIRLDDAVMVSDVAWGASLRRIRHIGDFRKWENHDQYQKAFERLMRDLKSELYPLIHTNS